MVATMAVTIGIMSTHKTPTVALTGMKNVCHSPVKHCMSGLSARMNRPGISAPTVDRDNQAKNNA